MTDQPDDAPDRSHPTVHRYRTSLAWTGSTGEGYDAYDRAHTGIAHPVAEPLILSSDPAFRGDPAHRNPEQLVVLAASSCQLLAFLAVAARARVDVVDYHDEATAEMPENDRPVRLTRIVLRPTITVRAVAGRPTAARVRRLAAVAHRECFIANSLRSEVVVEPEVRFAGD
jgi:organic hydroperoxide reductase OsmC/OhrA